MIKLDSILKSKDKTLLTKVHLVKAIIFPVVMEGRENWIIKKAEPLRTEPLNCGVGEDSCPLDTKEIQPVNPKGNQPWIFIRKTDAEAEALALWPHDVKSQVIGKDSDVGQDWSQEDKRAAKDEMIT